MPSRISAGATLSAALRRPLSVLAVDLGGPARFLTLRARKTPAFIATPKYITRGPKADALPIMAGHFNIKDQSLSVGPQGEPWSVPVPSEIFADQLHRFNWLHALASSGDFAAQSRARSLVDSWINTYGQWNRFAWSPDIIADRLINILSVWNPLLKSEDSAAQTRRNNLARQAIYLRKKYGAVSPGLPKLTAACALASYGAMADNKTLLDQSLDRLDTQLELQVLGDGGHISRQPAAIVTCLYQLIALESILETRGIPGSKQTRRAIDRLGPALDFFTLPDGKLTSFHGSGEGEAKAVARLAKQAGKSSKPFSYMPHSGFQRLAQNGTVMIVDTGDSPPRPFDTQAHLSPLALELSTPSGRLIVNCGYSSVQPEKWQDPMRETAAHSTLIIDDCSAGEIIHSKLHGTAIARSAGPAKGGAKEMEGDLWLESQHDGYLETTGLTHRRRIYMDALGVDIRGEDSLSVPMGAAPKFNQASFPFVVRFHIHPDVRVTLARDLASALLIFPNGDGWRFRTDSGPLALQKSVYLARGPRPERSEQLVVLGNALSDNDGEDRSNRVRWSFKRLGPLGDD